MKCYNCKQNHDTVVQVKQCHTGTTAGPRPPTERQLNYAHNLTRERVTVGLVRDIEDRDGMDAAREYINSMDFDGLSAYIGDMVDQPVRDEVPKERRVQVDEGMYLKDDKVYKVQRAVHGSGHLYAKVLNGHSFTYESGALSTLRPEHKMTLAQAKEYGALYGTCCVCGRTLTNEVSIRDGIGPICAGKDGWFA